MLESTDTSRQFAITPEGEYKMIVKSTPLKKATRSGKGFYYEWKFEYMDPEGKNRKTHTEIFMPWTVGPLLKALGFQEDKPDHFTWDREECQGKWIKCQIKHEAAKDGKIWARMCEIEPVVEEIPF